MILILEAILAGLIQWKTLKTQIEPKEADGGVQLSVYILSSDSDNNRSAIIPGDSLWEREEKERKEQKLLVLATARKASYKGSSSSFTGYGQAKKISQDYTNNCVVWAKKETGIIHPIGAGGRASIQGYEAKVGAIGVEVGSIPHAVVVVAINNDTLIVRESNYIKNWITERQIPKSRFIGFIYT